MSTNNIYFGLKESQELAGILSQRSETFFNTLSKNDYLEKLRNMWRYYHGIFNNTTEHTISFTGQQGELVRLPVNHFRNIAKHILTMMTSQRPIMDARAVNSDHKSMSQAYLANGILEYYMREKNLENVIKKAVEMAIVMGAGFIKLEWNATAGETVEINDETGEFSYQGDMEFTNLSPFDVVVDGTKESWSHEWMVTRSYQNKYNLAAKYPELAESIIKLQTKNNLHAYRLSLFTNDDTDDIPVYEFYHKPSEVLPEGRYMLFLDENIVLIDTKMPYREIPIYRIACSDIIGTPYSYSPMFDLYPLQEALNTLFSTVMTNQHAFGVQNLFVKTGTNVQINTLEGGLNIVQGDEPPSPLNLTQTPKEIFEFIGMLITTMETISGVNSVTRGNPELSLRSGTALALVQSMALQYMSDLQQSYVKLIENVGSGLLSMVKDFASYPRTIAIVGKNNRPYLKEFTGDDIIDITRVFVDVGNPLSRSTAGRVQMAEQLLQMKLLRSPEQYFQVLNTGRLDVTFEADIQELLYIKKENEELSEGKYVNVSPLDSHSLHINEHRALTFDTDIRSNAEYLKLIHDHIQMHVDALRETDPEILGIIGQQPLAPPGMVPDPNAQQNGGNAPKQNNGTQTLSQEQNPKEITDINGENTTLPNKPRPPEPFSQLPVTTDEVALN